MNHEYLRWLNTNRFESENSKGQQFLSKVSETLLKKLIYSRFPGLVDSDIVSAYLYGEKTSLNLDSTDCLSR